MRPPDLPLGPAEPDAAPARAATPGAGLDPATQTPRGRGARGRPGRAAPSTAETARSAVMRRVKGRDTGPELRVRAALRALGFGGYRLHRADLPGTPDIAFVGRRRAIFVHGCFWHGHDCRRGARAPATNAAYWRAKIARNVARDAAHAEALAARGWRTLTLWECELRDADALAARLAAFLAEA